MRSLSKVTNKVISHVMLAIVQFSASAEDLDMVPYLFGFFEIKE